MMIDIDRNIIKAAAEKAEVWLREWDSLPKTAANFNTPIAAGQMVDFMRAIVKAQAIICARPEVARSEKPVAWRYRYEGPGVVMEWRYVDLEEECNRLPGYKCEPLYAVSPLRRSEQPNTTFADSSGEDDK